MGKKTKTPAPPDPNQLIAAQQAANTQALSEAARFNQIGIQTPFGSQRFEGEIGSPDRTAVTELSPSGQAQLDVRNQLAEALLGLGQTRVSQLPTQALDFSGLPGLPGVDDFGAERQRVEEAQFQRARALIDPVFDEQAEQTRARLTAAGIPAEFQPQRAEFTDLNRRRDTALENAALSSVLAGGGEQSRLFGLADTARQRSLSEALLERGLPLQELASFANTIPLNAPDFGAPAQTGPIATDALAPFTLQQQAAQAAANRKAQAQSDNLSGLFGLGTAIATAPVTGGTSLIPALFGLGSKAAG